MESLAKKILGICEGRDLSIKEMPERGDPIIKEIYDSHRKYKNGFAVQLPTDNVYIMDSEGQVVYIGNRKGMEYTILRMGSK